MDPTEGEQPPHLAVCQVGFLAFAALRCVTLLVPGELGTSLGILNGQEVRGSRDVRRPCVNKQPAASKAEFSFERKGFSTQPVIMSGLYRAGLPPLW